MTTNYYFTLTFFTRKPRAEGYTDHKVYVRISAAGQYTDLYIGRSVNPDNWDQKRIIAKTKRATFKNETSKSSLFSLPFFSGSFDRLNTN